MPGFGLLPLCLGLLSLATLTHTQDADCDVIVVDEAVSGTEMRWTYDKGLNLCRAFRTKDTGLGPNIFESESKCMERCSKTYNQLYPEGAAVCELPVDPGMCLALIPMWYHDKELKRCSDFFYGGCQGNGNRFESKDACLSLCAPSKKGKSGASDASEPGGSKTDAGMVIGIIFGVVFGVAFLVTLAMYLVQRKKLKKQKKHKPVPATEMS